MSEPASGGIGAVLGTIVIGVIVVGLVGAGAYWFFTPTRQQTKVETIEDFVPVAPPSTPTAPATSPAGGEAQP